MEASKFVEIEGEENIGKLLPILKSRLPYSVFRFRERMHFFTLNGKLDQNSWIISFVVAEDYGNVYTISASEQNSTIPRAQALDLLSNSSVFKWDDPHLFTPLESWLTSLVFEVSVGRKGNCVEFHPSYIFTRKLEEAKSIQIENLPENIELRSLEPSSGLQFMRSTWKFWKEGSAPVITREIQRNESAGVYSLDGDKSELVCGVFTRAFGMLSALHTLPAHRGKGLARLAMEYAFNELAKHGIIPASGVDFRNLPSLEFHKKLGCEQSSRIATYIICGKQEF